MTELAAANGRERAEAMLKLTRRLTELITRETELFRERRAEEALALQDEKGQLANIYRAEVARAGQDARRFEGAPESLRAQLRESTTAFHDALAENGHVVNAMKTVTEGVVKAIADEAVRQRSSGSGYGPGAAQSSAPSSGFSIAVDRKA